MVNADLDQGKGSRRYVWIIVEIIGEGRSGCESIFRGVSVCVGIMNGVWG